MQPKVRPEYAAYEKAIQALAPLTPDQRLTVMEWVMECYCPNCGYPAPPNGEECGSCAVTNGERGSG